MEHTDIDCTDSKYIELIEHGTNDKYTVRPNWRVRPKPGSE